MLPRHDTLRYVLGAPEGFSGRPLPPFAPEVRAFLARLSDRLVADPVTRTMPDAMSFAWWCRRANVERQAAAYSDGALRIGRGIAFHVTPTNMPVNFAFSWVFSLLAGNANLVRIPNRDFPQIGFLLRHVEETLGEGAFPEVAAMNRFLSYGREDEITAALSALADVRIVWGGDATLSAIRRIPLPARGLDVGFADRYSFCVLGAPQVRDLGDEGLERLAAGFFNDTYLMDQNACSSPHLVVWLGASAAREAGTRFWGAVQAQVERRYELSAVSAMDKFTQACRDAIQLEGIRELRHGDNRVYQVELTSLFQGIETRRCNAGYFYEYATDDLDDVAPIVTRRYQTVTTHGVERERLASFVTRNRVTGIDRIVPVGAAMDIGLLWDGYDLIRTLSRVCDVR